MPSDERISEILAAAREVFSTQGYHGASVSDIAARLPVAEGTVFKYFPTKRDLLNQVIERWYSDLFGDYTKELSGIQGARERFRYLVWRHLRTIAEWPGMCRLIFSEVRSQPDYARSPLHRMNLAYTGLFNQVLEDGVRNGEFALRVPIVLVRDLVYGGIEHVAWGFLYGQRKLKADQLADQITDLVCGGIEPAPQREPALERASLDELGERLDRVAAALKRRAGEG